LKVYDGKYIRKKKKRNKGHRKEERFFKVSSKIEIFSNFSSTSKFIGPVKFETIQQGTKKQRENSGRVTFPDF
jgi:hypothetical protein